jgi:hypothetical protein
MARFGRRFQAIMLSLPSTPHPFPNRPRLGWSSWAASCSFSIADVPGFNYAIEASTNLEDWMPLATNTSPFTFVDGDATNFPARYYRAVYLP